MLARGLQITGKQDTNKIILERKTVKIKFSLLIDDFDHVICISVREMILLSLMMLFSCSNLSLVNVAQVEHYQVRYTTLLQKYLHYK